MTLSNEQLKNVENILTLTLRHKFAHYKPESTNMPFHTRLLGKDRLALYSFIHSLNTNFGTSIFEPVGVALAKTKFRDVKNHAKAGEYISSEAQIEIQSIIDNLYSAEEKPDKDKEVERIRNVCKSGNIIKKKTTTVDLMVETKEGELFLFDIKTAKPNIGNFKEFKRTLLEWVAVILADNPDAKVNTLIAIPYNPYEPKPYARWTIGGMLDLNKELKVANEFWDFLGGDNTYSDLLDCFEEVGINLRSEIDNYFINFYKNPR